MKVSDIAWQHNGRVIQVTDARRGKTPRVISGALLRSGGAYYIVRGGGLRKVRLPKNGYYTKISDGWFKLQ